MHYVEYTIQLEHYGVSARFLDLQIRGLWVRIPLDSYAP